MGRIRIYYRLCLNSLADRSLGNNDSAESAASAERVEAGLLTHHLEKLASLNRVTVAWGWMPERKTGAGRGHLSVPHANLGQRRNLRPSLYTQGQTQELADLLNQMYSANPSNIQTKHNLAMILLLEKSDLNKAHRLAQEAYQSAPDNPFYACTYAYSLLLQSRNQDAEKIIGSLKADYLKNPSIAAYYGIVEAQTGNPKAAAPALKVAQTAKLLPEEMQLVHQAQEGL